MSRAFSSTLLRRALPAILGALFAAPWAFAQRGPELDADTKAALEALRNLTPQGQATALAGIEESRREGELGPPQIPLLTALVEEPAWTAGHRRQVAFLLALLGETSKSHLDRLASSDNTAAQNAARDALKLHALVLQAGSSNVRRREEALEDFVRFAEAHPDSVNCVIAALVDAYTRKEETRRDIRIAALRSLAGFGRRAAPALLDCYANPDPFFFQHTKAALQGMTDLPREVLRAGLDHREPLVRQRIIETFLQLGIDAETAAAIDPLQTDRDEFVRKAALRAMKIHQARAKQLPSGP